MHMHVLISAKRIETLYREHYRALVRHARRWVGPHDAEDIVQDAFRYGWERTDGKAIPRDILSRLYRRTMHACFDLRRKLTRCEVCDPAAFEALPQTLLLDAPRNRELLDQLNEKVSDPESRRLIWCLLSGKTHAEIAEAESIPVGTVKSRIHALRKKLRVLKIT
jgi:RNA polymerase sigma factor (sigma-70 family)